ncbi:MAG: polyprenyl synthetase family protein [Acidobacteria bacterium]|nr:polyprenyl synthetase family protein [Acidobacteriota bacterium]
MGMKPHEIYPLVGPELARVEEELRGYTRSEVQPISEIAEYLLNAGGKRIRPALLLLTAKMLGQVSPMAIRLAAVVEFIHNATLVHDDIIDAADTRRGRPSANSHWGNSMTVLAGDWLYMQSFAVALGEKNLDVLNTLIEITRKMVEGELLQLTFLGKSQITEEQLLDIVERKTAYLFSGCMRLPGIAAGMNHGSAERLAEVGKSLGMAFQLVDDLLDLTSTKDVLGKPVANDLKEGKMTLPVLFAIRGGKPEDTMKVQKVLDEREFRSVDRAEILALVEQSDGLHRTRLLAERYAHRAIQLLEEFPASIYRDAIVSIPEFILNRSA